LFSSTGSAGGRPRVADSPANASASRERRDSPSRLRPAVAGWVERARGSLELARELSYLPFQGGQSSQDVLLIPEQLLVGGERSIVLGLGGYGGLLPAGSGRALFDRDAVEDFVVPGRFAGGAACVVLAAW